MYKTVLTILAIVGIASAGGFDGGGGWDCSSSWGVPWYHENLELNTYLDADSVDSDHAVINSDLEIGAGAYIFGGTNIPIWGGGSKLEITSGGMYFSEDTSRTAGDNDIDILSVVEAADASPETTLIMRLDDVDDLIDFLADTRFGALLTPDDGGEVAIFNRDVSASAVDGTRQGIIIRSDTTDVLSAGATADGSGGVDSVYVQFHGDVITESDHYGWTGSWVNAESDTVKVENGIIWDVVSP